jgi:hypothetical protein
VPKLPSVPKPRRLVTEVSDWWRYLDVRQTAGYLCAFGGIVLTVFTALTKGSNQLLLAVIAVFTQGIAAFLFAGHGKARPEFAKRAVQRLISMAERVSKAEKLAQDSFERKMPAAQVRDNMGILSTQFGYISDGIYGAVADWIAFNEFLKELVSEDQREAVLEVANESKIAVDEQSEAAKEGGNGAMQHEQFPFDIGDVTK